MKRLFLMVFLLGGLLGSCGTKPPVKMGQPAPNLTGKTPDGRIISLSSFHGKWVVLDFWASWCKPCHKFNPQLVKIYNKYKDSQFKNANGFTIFSVSLDNNVANWKAAIANDHLAWPNHISDLKGWASALAAAYGVRAIPANFIINPQGEIVAHNLLPREIGDFLNRKEN